MSTVFRAHDRQLERRVAIKILHEHYADDPEYLERFRREARAVAKLSHPNIVTVIDRGDDGGRQYIVFEHVEGENLKELVVRSGRLPVRRALELALDVADGLAFAHDHGLVHRDVKPQNVLLSREGEVKVTDFGIARSLHMEHGVTQTGTVLGTGEYLAPEQASGKQVSPATDVYSLGVVLWELLAGDVPFVGENFVAVALRHVNEPPPSLRERRPDVTPRLEAAVDRALAKDPGRRFPSMAAFAKELRACLAEAEGEVSPPPAPDDLELTRVTPPAPAPARAAADSGACAPAPPRAYVLLALARCRRGVRGRRAARRLGPRRRHFGRRLSGRPSSCTASASYDPHGRRRWSTTSYRRRRDRRKHGDGLDDADVRTDRTSAGSRPASGSSSPQAVPVKLAQLTVTTPTPGFTAEIQAGDSPTGGFTADSSSQTVNGTTTFTLDGQTATVLRSSGSRSRRRSRTRRSRKSRRRASRRASSGVRAARARARSAGRAPPRSRGPTPRRGAPRRSSR